MNKKLLVAAIMAALTISTSTTLAAPTFSGDARILSQKDDGAHTYTDTRFRLNADSEISDGFYAHARIMGIDDQEGANLFAAAGTGSTGAGVNMDQMYIGTKVGAIDVKAGRQALWAGNGMLADISGIQGLSLATDTGNIGMDAFVGRSEGTDVTAANLKTKGEAVKFGLGYLKEENTNYWALNADTKLTNNVVLSGNYVKNDTDNKNGFLVKATFGEAIHKGDFNYALSYRKIDDNAVKSDWTTDSAYNNSKGVRVEANYKVAENVSLNMYKDFTKTNDSNVGMNRAKAEMTVEF
ncbi:MAG: hypothetical protein H6Q73_1914 [Firmicutes bacterium]|nr:hypothetical protein [Bacillota bacterium]